MRNVLRKVALGSAFLTCPCHLPLYIVIFGGTAVGAFFSENLTLSLVLFTAYFALALLLGMKVLKPRRRTNDGRYTSA